MNIIKRFAKRRCHKKGRIDKKERKQKRVYIAPNIIIDAATFLHYCFKPKKIVFFYWNIAFTRDIKTCSFQSTM